MLKRIQSIFATMLLPVFALGTLILVFIVYMPSQAASAIYTVNSTADTNDGACDIADCTLREAILAANDTPDADIIVFSLPPSSTITLNGTQLPPITGTLTIDGGSAVNLTISGNNASRVLVIGQLPPSYPRPVEKLDKIEIQSSATVTINNLTIVDSNDGYGGAISNDGSLFIYNSHFENLASVYGAIYNVGYLRIESSLFKDNAANAKGGAIFSTYLGTIEINNSSFISNTANGPYPEGGVIHNGGVVTITNSMFMGNSVAPSVGLGNGGAIWSSSNGLFTIQNSTFISNSSNYYGGAILGVAAGGLTIKDSSFKGNSAVDGGAVWTIGRTDFINSTLNGNSASSEGGAIYSGGNTFIINSTVSENSAGQGGGIYKTSVGAIINSTINGNSAVDGGGVYNRGTLNFSNTIIANSEIGDDCYNFSSIGINVNNLVEDGSCNPLISGDPMLGPLQDNGGDTLTHKLLPGSPAIDAGHPDTCASPPIDNLDQRGNVRPEDGDGDGVAICDIGSYEAKYFDFTLVKNGPSVAASGEFITYTLTVVNNQLITATGVILTDTIPANANYISGGTLVGNVVSWTVPELSSGIAFTRSFIVTASQTITNDDYRVSASEGYSTTGNVPVVTIVAVPITGLTAGNNGPTILGNPTNLMATISTGSNVSYAWDFGDGSTGSGQFPSHIYPDVGQYTAVVTASNPLGEFTDSTLVTILDVPITGLNATNNSPTVAGSPTTLMASITAGTNVNYAWDFGDNTFGSGAVVMHTYPDVGQYTAVVTATNTSGSVVDTTIVTIEQGTWTIYLPVVLRSDSSPNLVTNIDSPIQKRVAVIPRKNWLFGIKVLE